MNLYFFPSNGGGGVQNPYPELFKTELSKHVKVVNSNTASGSSILDLYQNASQIDVVIFNWLENIGSHRLGPLQSISAVLLLLILKAYRVRIVWVLHNIHPHQGESTSSRTIKAMLFRQAELILVHSREAEAYAQPRAHGSILFAHHPVNPRLVELGNQTNTQVKPVYDFLIWGTIAPYKGIHEFLQYVQNNIKPWSIKIVGRCFDAKYERLIRSLTSANTSFDNRIVPFEELKTLIDQSRCVIFPYHSESVSSSGALLDTIALGGTVIGPNTGAFNDLAQDKVCFAYNHFDELDALLHRLDPAPLAKDEFIAANSWHRMICDVVDRLSS